MIIIVIYRNPNKYICNIIFIRYTIQHLVIYNHRLDILAKKNYDFIGYIKIKTSKTADCEEKISK